MLPPAASVAVARSDTLLPWVAELMEQSAPGPGSRPAYTHSAAFCWKKRADSASVEYGL
jgi:hypothetical protein